MLKFTLLISVFFVSILLFSCSSDSGTNNNDGTIVLGTMEAKLDGKNWKSQQALATKIGSEMYQITGASIIGATETITLTIKNTSEGTFSNGIGTVTVIDLNNPMSGSKSYNNINVSYTITAVSETEISGSFSFVAKNVDEKQTDSRNVENGRFRVKFAN